MPTEVTGITHILKRDWSPNVKPTSIGQHWIDRTARRQWLSVGTNSLSDWLEIGSSNGIAVEVMDRILNVARFATYTPSQPNTVIETLGYYDIGDGGHGSYYIDENDFSTPSDGGSVFVIADGRRAKLRIGGTVSVKRFGAKGDGVTDDTTAFTAWLAYIRDTKAGYVPRGSYVISATLNPLAHAKIYFDKCTLLSTVANAACIRIGSGVKLKGVLVIDCQNTAGSIGMQLGHGQKCEQAEIESIEVFNAAGAGLELRSNGGGTSGVYMNHFGKVRCIDCVNGLRLKSYFVGSGEVNANRFEFVSLQRNTTSVLVVDGGDGNSFGFIEAELNTGGFAIDLVRALGFHMDGGWIEGNTVGNLRIANDPDVKGVYIRLTCDSELNTSDTKFSHTFANTRSIFIYKQDSATLHGVTRVAGQMLIGTNGTAANDQGVPRLEIAGAMDLYRLTALFPYFYLRASPNSGLAFTTNGGTDCVKMETTGNCTFGFDAVFGAGKGISWDNGTEFVHRGSASDSVEIGVGSTAVATFDSTGVAVNVGDIQFSNLGTGLKWDTGTEFVRRASAGEKIEIGIASGVVAAWDDSATARNTRMLLYDVDNGTLERVTVGDPDSGGTGFKVLRIPN